MNWVEGKREPMRGTIETFDEFLDRNLKWWSKKRHLDLRNKKTFYDKLINHCHLDKMFSPKRSVAEVGPGPFGGILQVCDVPASRKWFIDYIMQDLLELHFIDWPKNATYVNAAAEDIPIADDTVDILISYNTLDHGWDIFQAMRECVRISRRCYLSFDCRDDVKNRQFCQDKDHWQFLKYSDICNFVYSEFGFCSLVRVSDLRTKNFPVAVVIVKK